MSVEFENQPVIKRAPIKKGKAGLPDLLIKWGVAENQQKANTILTIASIIFFGLSLVIWFL